MYKISKIFILKIVLLFSFCSILSAADMSRGLNCPPGWNDNKSARGNDLIKQCVSPSQDAFIELYAAPGQEVALGALLDAWAGEMTKRGFLFRILLLKSPDRFQDIKL
jgi:hypothetical protein